MLLNFQWLFNEPSMILNGFYWFVMNLSECLLLFIDFNGFCWFVLNFIDVYWLLLILMICKECLMNIFIELLVGFIDDFWLLLIFIVCNEFIDVNELLMNF